MPNDFLSHMTLGLMYVCADCETWLSNAVFRSGQYDSGVISTDSTVSTREECWALCQAQASIGCNGAEWNHDSNTCTLKWLGEATETDYDEDSESFRLCEPGAAV